MLTNLRKTNCIFCMWTTSPMFFVVYTRGSGYVSDSIQNYMNFRFFSYIPIFYSNIMRIYEMWKKFYLINRIRILFFTHIIRIRSYIQRHDFKPSIYTNLYHFLNWNRRSIDWLFITSTWIQYLCTWVFCTVYTSYTWLPV